MEIIFDNEEKELIRAFKDKQMAIDNSLPTAGERWTYLITPTGLGTVFQIKDQLLGKTEDLTNYEYFG